MRTILVSLLLMSVGHATASAESVIQLRRSTPYEEARETFLKLGYHPFMMPGAEVCDPDDARCFPEIESCSKARTWACTYTWRRGKAIIQVETRYAKPVVANAQCVVNCRVRDRKADPFATGSIAPSP